MTYDPDNPTTFGRIVTCDQVEAAARDTLQLWMPWFIAEVERQKELDARYFNGGNDPWFTTANQFDRFAEDQLPCIIVACPGLADKPTPTQDGQHLCTFAVVVAVVAHGMDHSDADTVAKAYGAAARAIMLQKGSLGGFADRTEWVDEQYDELPFEESRSMVGGRIAFTVEVDDVVTTYPMTSHLIGNTPPVGDPYDPPDDEITVGEAVIEATQQEE